MCHCHRTKGITPYTRRCFQKRHIFFSPFITQILVIYFLSTLLILFNVQISSGQLIQDQDRVPVFQFNRGGLITTIQYLKLDQSPFNFYEDVIVSKSGKLVIQEGVIIHFAPRKGLYVYGSLLAVVCLPTHLSFTKFHTSGFWGFRDFPVFGLFGF